MSGLLALGECMLELSPESGSFFRRSYAGDTYNTAVYAKRISSDMEVSFLTAVGTDAISEDMLATWQTEGLNTSAVLRSSDANPGLYAVTTDEFGERSFVYWRKHSAASQMMTLLKQQGGATSLPKFDAVYFSGISLAILSEQDRYEMIDLIKLLKSTGAKIAFDPNYRAKLWPDIELARFWMGQAYGCCDIALPGLQDHQTLFGHDSVECIETYLQKLQVAEMVIKCDSWGMHGRDSNGEHCYVPFQAVQDQVDSTAAGDSFAGTYIAYRLSGTNMDVAIQAAAAVAGFVVQHRGAIVNAPLFDEFCRTGGFKL